MEAPVEEEAELDLAESIFGDLEDEDDSPNPTEYRLQAIDLSSNSVLERAPVFWVHL